MACLADDESFRALETGWHELHDVCPDATPFNSWEWLRSWWQAYGEGRKLRLLVWRIDKTIVGIAPLYLVTEKSALGTNCNVLRFIGDGSYDSDHLGFLFHPSARSAIWQRFAAWLRTNHEWDALVLREITSQDWIVDELRAEAHRDALQYRVERSARSVMDLPESFDDFLKGRQARFRTKVRSLLRKLDQDRLVFETETEPRHLRKRVRSLYDLHQHRWTQAGGPGVFGSTSKRKFYAHFVPRFARRGWLRLYSLRNGDTYIAHELCFGGRGITYLLQEGFDARDQKASYGQMLRAAVVRHLIAHREVRYDFLGGVSKHKEDWGALEHETVHVVVARNNVRGWLYFNAPLWRERCAVAAKRLLPKPVIAGVRRMIARDS